MIASNLVGEIETKCSVTLRGHAINATSDSEQPSDIDATTVLVSSKPTVRVPLRSADAVEGSQVRLDCIIVGEPEPEVIWYHDGKPVKVCYINCLEKLY